MLPLIYAVVCLILRKYMCTPYTCMLISSSTLLCYFQIHMNEPVIYFNVRYKGIEKVYFFRALKVTLALLLIVHFEMLT